MGERRVPVVGWKLEWVSERGEEKSWDRLVSERGVYAWVGGMRERERRVMSRRGNIDEVRVVVVGDVLVVSGGGDFGFLSLVRGGVFRLEDMVILVWFIVYGWCNVSCLV